MNQDLTTLARLKAWYAVTPSQNVPNAGSADDNLLQELIEGCSQDILTFLDRPIILRATYTEYYNGLGGASLMLKQWPAVAVNSMTVNAVAQAAAVYPGTGYFLDPAASFPPGRQQLISLMDAGCAGRFPVGLKNVYISYDAGYCVTAEAGTIPASPGPYQVTAAQVYGAWAQDDGVKNATTGVALTKITGTPATGQYSVAAGVYTFAAADTGVAVQLSYSYVPSTLEKACFKMVAEEYSYRQRTGQKSHSIGGQTTASFDNSIMTPSIVKSLMPFKRVVPF